MNTDVSNNEPRDVKMRVVQTIFATELQKATDEGYNPEYLTTLLISNRTSALSGNELGFTKAISLMPSYLATKVIEHYATS